MYTGSNLIVCFQRILYIPAIFSYTLALLAKINTGGSKPAGRAPTSIDFCKLS